MVGNSSGPEAVLVRKTAEEYRNKGYEVSLNTQLDFLPEYNVALLVRKGDEVKVIEAKSRATLAANPGINDLARIIESKPGWSFELLLVAEPEKLESPTGAALFGREQIKGRIEEAEKLLELKHPDPALLLAWSAYEATIRLMLERQGVTEAAITEPGYVLEQATYLGIISREEYRRLKDTQKYRNAVAHGFNHNKFAPEVVSDLINTVRQMLGTT